MRQLRRVGTPRRGDPGRQCTATAGARRTGGSDRGASRGGAEVAARTGLPRVRELPRTEGPGVRSGGGADVPRRYRGYIHDPKEDDGPYIAVVLAPDKAPVITAHSSYAEAERELEHKLADLKQTILASRPRADDSEQP
jgi:hypothetical protein